jgi:DNA processing protein
VTKPWGAQRGQPGYPEALNVLEGAPGIPGAPETLYGLGDRDLVSGLDPAGAVTIVGARRASRYGIEIAEELGRTLAAAGFAVVSGMARGIDAAAHRGALAAGGATVAILGCGPDVVYPPGERRLHARLVAEGAVIAERQPGEGPVQWAFPARNRLMAALGGMTVVVEASERSGSSITADYAERCGRMVGAVPGNVNSWLSAGTNRLIFDGATPIRDAQDVLDVLVGVGAGAIAVRGAGPPLDDELLPVLDLVEAGEASADGLANASGMTARDAAVALGRLELLGYVSSGLGGYSRTSVVRP